MIISETFTLAGSRDRVASLLLDPGRVATCVPGVTGVVEVAPNEYEADLSVRLGPIKTNFRGSITIDDSRSPERLGAIARGKDQASGSMATVRFDARLRESPEPVATLVEATADVTIRGKLGRFGTGVIGATAKQMIEDFASCVDTTLSARSLPLLRTFWLGLWARMRSVLVRKKSSR